MLVNLTEILKDAIQNKYAVGSFNTPNLETVVGVVQAAEKLNAPVIIMHAEVHESLIPLSLIGPIMLHVAKQAKVPVCVHLDHGENIAYIQEAIKLGFSSVMYDGSALPYEENLSNTKQTVAFAKKYKVSVEAELGIINREGSENASTVPARYTDPEAARDFVEASEIDALACAFGTAHGIYKEKPQLDFNLLTKIAQTVDIPLVMHGGSGISTDDYQQAIQKGIRKINYYTYMAKYAGEKVRDKLTAQSTIPYYHDIASLGTAAVAEHAEQILKIFRKPILTK